MFTSCYLSYLHLHVFLVLPCDLTQFSDSQKERVSLEKALLSWCTKSFVIFLSGCCMYYLAEGLAGAECVSLL